MKKPKTVFIKTFGCQMNARDSEFVMGLLLENGFTKAESIEKADVILFNSCSVRKHAEDRLFGNIGELKHLKKKKPGLVVGLMGCTAQSFKAKVLERAPLLDFSCGPGDEFRLPDIIKDVLKFKYPIVATEKVNEKTPELFPAYREGAFKTYVSIGQGCNNFCSYCIVPYVRGRERSRDAKDIIREVKELAARGFKEVTLLGQNVNSYKNSGRAGLPVRRSLGEGGNLPYYCKSKASNFIGLLEQLNSIKGIERIRFMTSHPKDASTDLFKAMRDLEKVCEHLHLPVQSGSDRILKLMNRGYARRKYMALVESYRKILPEAALTTDIIVGFPSEAKEDHKDTLELMSKARFDSAYTFKYSSRPPAKSSALVDDVEKVEKDARLKEINDVQAKISEELNSELNGKTYEVLVDGVGKNILKLTGRTRANKIVVFTGSKRSIGKIVNVEIESVSPYALKGMIA